VKDLKEMNTKQAACLNCRKSKIKCRREEGAPICQRCENVGAECVIPEFHIGRQKGVKKYRTPGLPMFVLC
jgi:hypothetical protein